MANLTIAQIEDAIGKPIVLLTAVRRSTGKVIQITFDDLPPVAQAAVLAWLNANL
jgi:hypothetical protein